jgi:hypothetical protein
VLPTLPQGLPLPEISCIYIFAHRIHSESILPHKSRIGRRTSDPARPTTRTFGFNPQKLSGVEAYKRLTNENPVSRLDESSSTSYFARAALSPREHRKGKQNELEVGIKSQMLIVEADPVSPKSASPPPNFCSPSHTASNALSRTIPASAAETSRAPPSLAPKPTPATHTHRSSRR